MVVTWWIVFFFRSYICEQVTAVMMSKFVKFTWQQNEGIYILGPCTT